MLEVLAQIASILGLARNVFKDFTDKNKGDKNAEILGVLLALKSSTKNWKTVHLKYHALSSDIRTIAEYIQKRDGAICLPKRASEIHGNELRNLFYSRLIRDAIYCLDTELNVEINHIRRSIQEFEKEYDNTVEIFNEYRETSLLDTVERINQSQKLIVSYHDVFIELFKKIRIALQDNDWTISQVNMVLGYVELLNSGIDKIIMSTDQVVMDLLNIHEWITNKIEW